jgi:hypothetical protein
MGGDLSRGQGEAVAGNRRSWPPPHCPDECLSFERVVSTRVKSDLIDGYAAEVNWIAAKCSRSTTSLKSSSDGIC